MQRALFQGSVCGIMIALAIWSTLSDDYFIAMFAALAAIAAGIVAGHWLRVRSRIQGYLRNHPELADERF
jgi:formate/nitrite transporter FocA (FNT family)